MIDSLWKPVPNHKWIITAPEHLPLQPQMLRSPLVELPIVAFGEA